MYVDVDGYSHLQKSHIIQHLPADSNLVVALDAL